MRFLSLLFIICFAKLLSAQTLVRGPYLTMATQHSITISWRTSNACNSIVSFGSTQSTMSVSIINNALLTDHVITLYGLTENSKYYYTIGTNNSTLQGDSSNYFKTLPLPSSNYSNPIRIWAVGDVGKATSNETQMIQAFEKHVGDSIIDGFIMLGDNAYESGLDLEYQNGFFSYFQNSVTKHITLWPVLGNHDYANDALLRQNYAIPYFDVFTLPQQGECGGIASNTERYYSFTIGNVHFVNLDSYGQEQVGGTYYGLSDTAFSPQVQWLKQDLNANTSSWVIVSFHHPPYCMGTHNSDSELELVYLREKINPILERYNVDLVLNGHSHTYERSNMLHKHYGNEASYNSVFHKVQNTSGLNDNSANSCPYIKNSQTPQSLDSGVLYVVIGSGSAIPITPQSTWPHDAMYYSNYEDNGSLLLTFTGNQMLAEWISTDSNHTIKDQFTIYKHVNLVSQFNVIPGDSVTLFASWTHDTDYVWNTNDTTHQITLKPLQDQIITVSDKKGCFLDSFIIHMVSPNNVGENLAQKISIAPNPVHETLIVQGLQDGYYKCVFSNLLGMQEVVETFKSNKNIIEINTTTISSGIYFISIVQNNKVCLRGKLIIQH